MRARKAIRSGLAAVRGLRLAPVWVILALPLLVLLSSASPVHADDTLCVNCHSDMARLESLSTRAKRIYVDPVQRSQDIHGAFMCTTCHGGDPTIDSPEACLGVAYKDPTDPDILMTTCGTCHEDISTRYFNSVHNTVNGIHHSLMDLLGAEDGTARFDQGCKKCHASCADCHLREPDRRGLLWPRVESHRFDRVPASNVCGACHGAASDTFFGEPGNEEIHPPSVMAVAGMLCTDCHREQDVHGTGTRSIFVAESDKPTCESCHRDPAFRWSSNAGQTVAPQYNVESTAHAIHGTESLSCEACHTQWYPSCWNCHEGRPAKTVYDLFLANNPLTGKIHPIARSPASAPDWGPIPPEIGGEWAIKSRHSWGTGHTCETCHTSVDVYVNAEERRAPFLGLWRTERANASYIDQALVDVLVIDPEAMKADVHAETACTDCHASQTDTVCTECHERTEKSGTTFLSAEADWSRTPYSDAHANLKRSAELLSTLSQQGRDVSGAQASYEALRMAYLAAANAFHSAAGESRGQMEALAGQSAALRATLEGEVQAKEAQRRLLYMGIPLAIGVLGTITVGMVFYKPERKKGGRS